MIPCSEIEMEQPEKDLNVATPKRAALEAPSGKGARHFDRKTLGGMQEPDAQNGQKRTPNHFCPPPPLFNVDASKWCVCVWYDRMINFSSHAVAKLLKDSIRTPFIIASNAFPTCNEKGKNKKKQGGKIKGVY
jgi:hypothetical protein